MNKEDIFYIKFTEYVQFINEISNEIFEKLSEEKQIQLTEILSKINELMEIKNVEISYEYYYILVKDYLKCIIEMSVNNK